jgi:hypothetical protein
MIAILLVGAVMMIGQVVAIVIAVSGLRAINRRTDARAQQTHTTFYESS